VLKAHPSGRGGSPPALGGILEVNNMDLAMASQLVASSSSLISALPNAAERKQLFENISNYLQKEWKVTGITKDKEWERRKIFVNTVMNTTATIVRDCDQITDTVRKHCYDLCLCILWQILENDGALGLQRYTRSIGTLLGLNKDRIPGLSKELEEQPEGIDEEVPFTAVDVLRLVVAVAPPVSVVFTD
jgi:hypothetical protein